MAEHLRQSPPWERLEPRLRAMTRMLVRRHRRLITRVAKPCSPADDPDRRRARPPGRPQRRRREAQPCRPVPAGDGGRAPAHRSLPEPARLDRVFAGAFNALESGTSCTSNPNYGLRVLLELPNRSGWWRRPGDGTRTRRRVKPINRHCERDGARQEKTKALMLLPELNYAKALEGRPMISGCKVRTNTDTRQSGCRLGQGGRTNRQALCPGVVPSAHRP